MVREGAQRRRAGLGTFDSIQYELPHACGHKVHHGGPRPPFYQRHGQPDAKLRLYESVTIEVRLDWGEITNAPTMNKALL